MNDNGQLADIKVGDRVAYFTGGYRSTPVIHVVRKVTEKQIVLRYPGNNEDGWRFWKANGHEVGKHSTWHRARIGPVTPDIEAEIARAVALNEIRRTVWETLSDATLFQVREVLRQSKQTEKVS